MFDYDERAYRIITMLAHDQGVCLKVPETLFKYTSAESTIKILESTKLRWSSPCQFNDLNELQRMPTFDPTVEEGWNDFLEKIIEIALDKSITDLNQYSPQTQLNIQLLRQLNKSKEGFRKLLKELPAPSQEVMDIALRSCTDLFNDGSLRVFCLTEDDKNDVMWTHYGSNHTGCVLGFKHIPELSTAFKEAERVTYTKDDPVIGSSIDFLLYGNIPELNKRTTKAIYYTKGKNWDYEKEWRTMIRRPSIDGALYSDLPFLNDELESLTFGARIEKEDELKISALIQGKYPKCKLYKVVINKGKLSIIQVKLG